jgi:hypothetical protein
MPCQGSMCADCEREQFQKAYYGTPAENMDDAEESEE